jgi:hypothetical protein
MAKNLIFCSILLICSIAISSLKLQYPKKQFCDDNYKYDINTNGGKVMVVSEAYWKNRLQPSLNGRPANPKEDDEEYDDFVNDDFEEEFENFEDGKLILNGGNTEVYDSKGQKLRLSELDVWDEDVEDILVDESDLEDVNKLVVDSVTEVIHPSRERVDGDRVTEDIELIGADDQVYEDTLEEEIEEEFLEA